MASPPGAGLLGRGMLILLNKPYDMLCQFTDGEGRQTLADVVPVKGVYPPGGWTATPRGWWC